MIGKTISHYKILEKLGEGGMGVVYKAQDTKLKRTVALKFLPPHVLGTDEEKDRFVREAQAAAALSHPNICTIYEIDEDEGKTFIAMEYVEGRRLKDEVEKGPLKLERTVDIAIQVSEGLKRAHEKGIVHRDIKSANIMITQDGTVKILDFGLAKLSGKTKLTKTGSTMGTISYMSPEQAQGEKVDHRSDIWSVGVVLYEMICGKLPFQGEYDQAVMYNILNQDPEPLTGLRTGVPMELERIVIKLLAKEPGDRYQHIDELPVDLKAVDLSKSVSSTVSTTRSTNKIKGEYSFLLRTLPWGITAMSILVTLILIFSKDSSKPTSVKRSHILLPNSAPLTPLGHTLLAGEPALAISPDGSKLAYVADISGKTLLHIRYLDQFKIMPLSDTEGASCPFFSPDGKMIAFFADDKLKKVSISGGKSIILCEAINSAGGSWENDQIIFSQHDGNTLTCVSTEGEILWNYSGNWLGSWPEILPGGEAVLFSDLCRGIRILFPESGKDTLLIEGWASYTRYIPAGFLLYQLDGRIEAIRFDIKKLQIVGSPITVIDSVRTETAGYAAQYDISNDGTLVYIPGSYLAKCRFVWVNRQGEEEVLPFPAGEYWSFEISPEGERLAVSLRDAKWMNIWIYDLNKKQRTKFTFEKNNFDPRWTPDGKWITFQSDRTGYSNIFKKRADRTGQPVQLTTNIKATWLVPYSWSPNGETLAIWVADQSQYSIWLLPDSGRGTPVRFTETQFNDDAPDFSLDGGLIAYTSDSQGHFDVYVEPYPKTGELWHVSSEAGFDPLWSPKTNELFYTTQIKRQQMVVAYKTEPTFIHDIPKMLFVGDYAEIPGRGCDISPDGKRFLMLKSAGEDVTKTYTQINIITNWFDELKRLSPTKNK